MREIRAELKDRWPTNGVPTWIEIASRWTTKHGEKLLDGRAQSLTLTRCGVLIRTRYVGQSSSIPRSVWFAFKNKGVFQPSG